eukprot:1365254-Amorphochlora_amoeboformis.AAC.1
MSVRIMGIHGPDDYLNSDVHIYQNVQSVNLCDCADVFIVIANSPVCYLEPFCPSPSPTVGCVSISQISQISQIRRRLRNFKSDTGLCHARRSETSVGSVGSVGCAGGSHHHRCPHAQRFSVACFGDFQLSRKSGHGSVLTGDIRWKLKGWARWGWVLVGGFNPQERRAGQWLSYRDWAVDERRIGKMGK